MHLSLTLFPSSIIIAATPSTRPNPTPHVFSVSAQTRPFEPRSTTRCGITRWPRLPCRPLRHRRPPRDTHRPIRYLPRWYGWVDENEWVGVIMSLMCTHLYLERNKTKAESVQLNVRHLSPNLAPAVLLSTCVVLLFLSQMFHPALKPVSVQARERPVAARAPVRSARSDRRRLSRDHAGYCL